MTRYRKQGCRAQHGNLVFGLLSFSRLISENLREMSIETGRTGWKIQEKARKEWA